MRSHAKRGRNVVRAQVLGKKVARKGIARARGIRDLARHCGLLVALAAKERTRARRPHREHHIGAREHPLKSVEHRFWILLARELLALDLVHEEQPDGAKIARIDTLVKGARIEHHAHAARGGRLDDLRKHVDLVLQHDHVTRAKTGKCIVDRLLRHRAVGAAKKDDRVLARFVDLDDRVARALRQHAGAAHIDTRLAA